MCGQMRHTLLADRREIQTAPPQGGGRSGPGNHHPSPQGGQSTPGQRRETGHPSGGCLRRRRFKVPFESPPFAPTLTRRRPLRAREPAGTCAFAGAAIAWRFLRHPHAMARIAPAHQRARTAGIDSCRYAASAVRDRVSATVSLRPALSSASIHSPAGSKRLRRWKWRAARGRASHRHRSGLKIPARPLSASATSREYAGSHPLL
jgi:hypothetical protein